jgi:hypothetical protein
MGFPIVSPSDWPKGDSLRMKETRRRWLGVMAILATGGSACNGLAQIDLSARPLHPRFLQGEVLEVLCRVVNRGLDPIELGPGGNAEFRMVIERKPGYEIDGSGRPVVGQPITIAPRRGETFTLNLSKTHHVGRTGPYTLFARLRFGDEVYASSHAFLDVVPGLVLKSVRAAVPGERADRRVFSLRSMMRDGSERLFLRIDADRSSVCYGVLDLGRLMGFFAPQLEIDAEGRSHVLHLSSPTQYTYSIYGPNGEPVSATFLQRQSGPARLDQDDAGGVAVQGVQPLRNAEAGQRPPIRTFDPFE